MMGGGGKSEGEILIWYLSKSATSQIAKISFQCEKIACCDIHKSGKYVAISVGSGEVIIYTLPDIFSWTLPALIQKSKSPFLPSSDADGYFTEKRININGVYTIKKLKFFAHSEPKWILVNDKIINYETEDNLSSWSDDLYSFGYDNCIKTDDWIFINDKNIICLKKELNAIHDENAAFLMDITAELESKDDAGDKKEVVPFYVMPQDSVTRESLQSCSDKENVVIRYNKTGHLFAYCHLRKIYVYEILSDKDKGYKEQMVLIHIHELVDNPDVDKQEITFLEWLDECTLIYCVRNLKNMKLKYNLYWLRSMKDDPIRQEIVGECLDGIMDLTKIILSMLGFEKSAPIQTSITQRVSNISVVELLEDKDDDKRNKRGVHAMVISCCGAANAKANQVLDCMIIHPINASMKQA